MDKDVTAKDPVTRLKRRLSVEPSEESMSPTPSTPTKKRGARSGKPQLELIGENGPEKTPTKRTTRKSILKDGEEDRPLTPSRRSARIRSNTSIISDTPQNPDTPRAKRATRRNSQVGSDNETPIQATTPARTKRTRKDSTKTIDKPVDSTLITDVISEEPELVTSTLSKTPENLSDETLSPIRKSMRLQTKQKKRLSANLTKDSNFKGQTPQKVVPETTQEKTKVPPKSPTKKISVETSNDVTTTADLSHLSRDLIEKSCKQPLKTSNFHNKSLSSIKEVQHSKRTRTKSWTALTMSPINDNYFLSDNENAKKKVKRQFNIKNDGKSGSGDSIFIDIKKAKDNFEIVLNTSTNGKKNQDQSKTESDCLKETNNDSLSKQDNKEAKVAELISVSETEKLFEVSPEAVIRSKVYIEDSDSNTDVIEKHGTEDQCVPVVSNVSEIQSNSPKLTQVNRHSQSCEPMDIDETMPDNVILNDSDDKSKSFISLKSKDQNKKKEDVVDSQSNTSNKQSSISNSITENKQNCENFVDVDDKINKCKNVSLKSSFNEVNDSKRKSVSANLATEDLNNTVDVEPNDSLKQSKRKLSLSNSIVDETNTSNNQNKSTLVLSQKKDSFVILSKNENILNVTDVDKNHKILQNVYSTSTPLQDKIATKILKQRAPINVSDILNQQSNTSKLNKTQTADKDTSDDDSDDDHESASGLVIDEAEETSDNYESGDSQDEEERNYEHENEIVDKGETLTSDDDVSNDTDYEKDSFVVTSDEEDNELLDGSGDDLEMTDNELTMTAKSKKKYNERKSREQKQASREMFEARHKSNKSKNKINDSKSDKKLDSKLLDSDDDSKKSKAKKINRLRLDSSPDTSIINSGNETIQIKKKKSERLSESVLNSDADESMTIKKKKVKRLSESINENIDETEMTVCDVEITEKDPLEKIKEEPKTPQKSFMGETIENVDVDENVSIMKVDQCKDPLQSTIAQEEHYDSDISSNPEITLDYSNLLNNLNKIRKKEKKKDMSLNIDRKSKEPSREPIVDQLNLTLTKKDEVFERHANNNKQSDEEDSSDSIDIKLLFTEDSNDSEDQPKADKNKSAEENDFIPLKKTVAKTNIHEDETNSIKSNNVSHVQSLEKKKNNEKSYNESVNKSLNISLKKNKDNSFGDEGVENKTIHNVSNNQLNSSSKKKKKNSITSEELTVNDTEEPILIIHDTIGNRKSKKNSISKDDILEINTSKTKNKKNRMSEDLNESAKIPLKLNDDNKNEDDESDLPEEIPFTSTKNKIAEVEIDISLVVNTSLSKKGKKQKKKQNISLTSQEGIQAAAALYETDECPKIKRSQVQSEDISGDNKNTADTNSESNKKKRRHKKKYGTSDNANNEPGDNQNSEESRKRKLSTMSSVESAKDDDNSSNVTNNTSVAHKNKKKKQKLTDNLELTSIDPNIQLNTKENRKRKKRDEDIDQQPSKVPKEIAVGKKEIARLPVDIINKLDDKPDKLTLEKKKASIVSTSEFIVETAKVRKNKPSQYLEESIYLNEDLPENSKGLRKIKKPKVLPFVPTAATSGFGFTTNFKVSVIPTETKFEAKTTKDNFKMDYLNKKLKKFGTYELLKTQRKVKLSKF